MLLLAVVLAVVVLVQGNGAGSWTELLEVAAAVKANISMLCEAQPGQLCTL